jgi:hypothetical protein
MDNHESFDEPPTHHLRGRRLPPSKMSIDYDGVSNTQLYTINIRRQYALAAATFGGSWRSELNASQVRYPRMASDERYSSLSTCSRIGKEKCA